MTKILRMMTSDEVDLYMSTLGYEFEVCRIGDEWVPFVWEVRQKLASYTMGEAFPTKLEAARNAPHVILTILDRKKREREAAARKAARDSATGGVIA